MSGVRDRFADGLAVRLAARFRAASTAAEVEAVAADVVCDGPSALGMALLLDREELGRLVQAVDAHPGGPTGHPEQDVYVPSSMRVGGEARGGPVLIPLRGSVS